MLILVMGVTGAGKTTVGQRLATRLGLPFYDADDFHPPANRQKMAANQPLDDRDRMPWLASLAARARDWERTGGAVLACSALKRAYREVLFQHVVDHRTVYLEIGLERASLRLDQRRGHHEFIRDYDHVLSGQYRDLEPPEAAISVSAELNIDDVVEGALVGLQETGVGAVVRAGDER
jgi:carbohydrate kinase (thermoresistant glucokinase family)